MKKFYTQGSAYEAPALELLTMSVEQGFAASTDGTISDWEDDGDDLNA